MYPRVIAETTWEGSSDRNTFIDNLVSALDDRGPYHERTRHEGQDPDGRPTATVDVRPESATDADEIYQYIADQIDRIPALTGQVHVHECTHDEGPPFETCTPDKEHSA